MRSYLSVTTTTRYGTAHTLTRQTDAGWVSTISRNDRTFWTGSPLPIREASQQQARRQATGCPCAA